MPNLNVVYIDNYRVKYMDLFNWCYSPRSGGAVELNEEDLIEGFLEELTTYIKNRLEFEIANYLSGYTEPKYYEALKDAVYEIAFPKKI